MKSPGSEHLSIISKEPIKSTKGTFSSTSSGIPNEPSHLDLGEFVSVLSTDTTQRSVLKEKITIAVKEKIIIAVKAKVNNTRLKHKKNSKLDKTEGSVGCCSSRKFCQIF